jgi:Domain of unknown function (DUF4082)
VAFITGLTGSPTLDSVVIVDDTTITGITTAPSAGATTADVNVALYGPEGYLTDATLTAGFTFTSAPAIRYIWHGGDPSGVADTGRYTMGTTFCPLVNLTIVGLRLYVVDDGTPAAPGQRLAKLWRASDGALLGQGSLPDTLTGMNTWQVFNLTTPIPVTGRPFNDRLSCLLVSVETSADATGTHHYASLSHAFDTAVTSPDGAIILPADGAPGVGATVKNGAFQSPVGGTMPDQSFNATFYGVDLAYTVP